MMLDSSLALVPFGSPLSLVGANAATFASNVIDLLGAGVGMVPPNIIGVNNALFGTDPGAGTAAPRVAAAIGTAVVSAGGGTITASLQYAVDTGAAGNYQPGAWITASETGQMTAAQLAAGAVFARLDLPRIFPINQQPRFMRLLFTIGTAAITAGTVSFAYITFARDDINSLFIGSNYTA